MRRPVEGLRVLIVTASATRRGAEIEACQLADQLRRHGVVTDVTALTVGASSHPLPIDTLGRRRFSLTTLRALRRCARRHDVVLAYGSSTLPACAVSLVASRVPFVYRSIGDPERWIRGRVHRAVTAIQFRRARRVVALWTGAARSIERLYGVDPSRIDVIPNARDPTMFRPPSPEERAAARASHRLGDERAIAFIGTLSPEKRVGLAIRALAKTPDHVMIVVGDGPELGAAEDLAREVAPGRVRFVGELRDVVPVLHAVDAVLITSDTEGMPGVAIEALMCGIPVVATAVGALPEMHGVRLLAGTPAAIAGGIDSAASGVSAPPGGEEYVWSAVVDRWLEVLRRTASSA